MSARVLSVIINMILAQHKNPLLGPTHHSGWNNNSLCSHFTFHRAMCTCMSSSLTGDVVPPTTTSSSRPFQFQFHFPFRFGVLIMGPCSVFILTDMANSALSLFYSLPTPTTFHTYMCPRCISKVNVGKLDRGDESTHQRMDEQQKSGGNF